jgi:hypothetical protein
MKLLDQALVLLSGTVPYTEADDFCRRLINQAVYERIIISSDNETSGQLSPLYAHLIPPWPGSEPGTGPEGRRGPRRGREPTPTPFFGAGVRIRTKWRRGGDSNPRTRLTPVTRFPVAPVQPLRHLSGNRG